MTTTLEAANYFQTGKYKQLSAQQLVDCATDEYQNFGCDGGTPMYAMAYTDQNPIESAHNYPYKGFQHSFCRYDEDKGIISANSFTLLSGVEAYLI